MGTFSLNLLVEDQDLVIKKREYLDHLGTLAAQGHESVENNQRRLPCSHLYFVVTDPCTVANSLHHHIDHLNQRPAQKNVKGSHDMTAKAATC